MASRKETILAGRHLRNRPPYHGFLRRISLPHADIGHGAMFDRQVLVAAFAALAGRRLRQQTDLGHLAGVEREEAHHVEMLAVQRIVEGEGVTLAAHLQPDRVGVHVGAVGVVGDALGHHADHGAGAEVGQLEAGLGPVGQVLEHHDRAGVIGLLEIVRYLDAQHKIALDLGVVERRVAQRVGYRVALLRLRTAVAEEIGVLRGKDADHVVPLGHLRFVEPLEFHCIILSHQSAAMFDRFAAHNMYVRT